MLNLHPPRLRVVPPLGSILATPLKIVYDQILICAQIYDNFDKSHKTEKALQFLKR